MVQGISNKIGRAEVTPGPDAQWDSKISRTKLSSSKVPKFGGKVGSKRPIYNINFFSEHWDQDKSNWPLELTQMSPEKVSAIAEREFDEVNSSFGRSKIIKTHLVAVLLYQEKVSALEQSYSLKLQDYLEKAQANLWQCLSCLEKGQDITEEYIEFKQNFLMAQKAISSC